MEERTKIILKKFEESWHQTRDSYQNLLYHNPKNFHFVIPIINFMDSMKDSGEAVYFRFGTSMHTLVLSRSVNHGLREDQKEIRIEHVNHLEYEICLREGLKIYREFKITKFNDYRFLSILQALKKSLVD